MLLSQIKTQAGKRSVVVREGTEAYTLSGVSTTYQLVIKCIQNSLTLAEQINRLEFEQAVDLQHLYTEHKLVAPIEAPSAIQQHVTGEQDMPTMPKIAAISVVAQDGNLLTIGYCMAYILSDARNLNHSFLPTLEFEDNVIALGPEILTGGLPQVMDGILSQVRNGKVIFNDNLGLNDVFSAFPALDSKYQTSLAGDVFIQLFSPFKLFEMPHIRLQEGDFFELEIAQFGLPMENLWQILRQQKPSVA
ncbi:MAG: hypothetical protein COB24_06125 [Hyphomicrobiales bacterium]|nr:MAG: hypothetical protein COB24_06125 [Hyphomicrobiales bacterium]